LKANFGVHIPIQGAYDYHAISRVSEVADSLGYDSLWVGDHFYLPSSAYSKIGSCGERPDKLDAWTILAAIAVRTKRIKLGTRVSPIPFYLPGKLAKIVTTVDIISGGRSILGAGGGWFKEESVSYGIGWWSHKERILRMQEGLEIILSLWKEERTTYKGKHYQVEDAPFWPKPIQKPHPPIWFGGSSNAIVEATVKYGHGILPLTNMTLDKFESLVLMIREAERRLGKTKSVALAPSLSYPNGIGGTSSKWIETIEPYFEKGASSIIIDFSQNYVPVNTAVKFLEEFAGKIFPQYRSGS